MTKITVKSFVLLSAIMLVSFSNYAATLTCKGTDSDQGQVNLSLQFDPEKIGQNVPLYVDYRDLMNDGYEAERTWEAEVSIITKTKDTLVITAGTGDYSWFDLELKLQTQDGIHYTGTSRYEENDSGWELLSEVSSLKCILKN